jgi:hypothetical protein
MGEVLHLINCYHILHRQILSSFVRVKEGSDVNHKQMTMTMQEVTYFKIGVTAEGLGGSMYEDE